MNKLSKTKNRKSISDKISDLLAPKPLLDPEVDSADETTAKTHEYSDEDDVEPDFVHRLSDIRKKNVPLLQDVDSKYSGEVTSRKDIDSNANSSSDDEQYEDSSSEEEPVRTGFSMRVKQFESDDENETLDNDEEADSDELQSGDDNGHSDDDTLDDGDEENDEESVPSNDSGTNLDADNSAQDSDDDDESDFEAGDMFPQTDEEAGDDDKTSDKTAGLSTIVNASRNSADMQKGVAVQNQLKIWEKLLEMRIHSQKVLIKANSMPTLDKFQNLCAADQSFAELAQKTCANVSNLLEKMCEMEHLLVKQYPETKELAVHKRKSSADDDDEPLAKMNRLSSEIGGAFERYTDYRDATITKWYDRTKVLTPGLKASKVNPFNVVHSIRSILANRQELVRKTQQHKGGYELFDQKAATAEHVQPKPIDEPKFAEDGHSESVETASVHCAEIYDDTDFYHTQLRELIEFKANTSNSMGDMTKQFIELQKLRNKVKKVVDTRASKGRKIRYVVHNKMVNFMAQNTDSNWTKEARDELFSSLFGAKTHANVATV